LFLQEQIKDIIIICPWLRKSAVPLPSLNRNVDSMFAAISAHGELSRLANLGGLPLRRCPGHTRASRQRTFLALGHLIVLSVPDHVGPYVGSPLLLHTHIEFIVTPSSGPDTMLFSSKDENENETHGGRNSTAEKRNLNEYLIEVEESGEQVVMLDPRDFKLPATTTDFKFELPYEGARYKIDDPVDFGTTTRTSLRVPRGKNANPRGPTQEEARSAMLR
jgi:hypothetical protein